MYNSPFQLMSERLAELLAVAEGQARGLVAPDPTVLAQVKFIDEVLDLGDDTRAAHLREHDAFVKALRYGPKTSDLPALKLACDDDEWKTMTMADDQSGGFLCSDEFVQMVVHQLATASTARQLGRVIPVGPSTGGLVPVMGAVTATRVQETQDRSLTADDPDLRLARLGVHEASAMTLVSRTLLQDARYDLAAELAIAAANGFAALEAQELITGTGQGLAGLNLTDLPTTNKVTCADSSGHTVTLDDLLKLIFKSVDAQYLPGSKLLMNPKLFGTLHGLKATSGASFMAPIADSPNTLLGIPVVFASALADNATPAAGNIVAYFIAPQAYAIAERQAMVVQRHHRTENRWCRRRLPSTYAARSMPSSPSW